MGVALVERVTKEVTDQVDALDQEITEREKALHDELASKVEERDELKELLSRMKNSGSSAPARKSRGSGRRKGVKRAEEFVKIVTDNPGITASEAAEKVGIKPNYVYRLKKDAVEAGLIRVDGRKLFPVESD